jgi:alpha-L-glutamate ligase-like protein/uncharacterized protein (TIGR02421 family)
MFNWNRGLLGINARNLIYIQKLNKREAIRFADSKLKTKHYLAARGIPVPKLFGVIRNHEELNNFDFGSLPGNIVLKPNRGAGGDGILVFKERKGSDFITAGGRTFPLEDMKNHINDILDGRFSINGIQDTAFFEQRIETDAEVTPYTYKGLPDIRIIVYNLIPVMAMLRLPTRESEGRANMAQGALGVGIDLATGKPTYIAKKNKIIKEIPDVGKFSPDFKIPHWDEMLLIASKCQMITNLGYLAVDIAIDETAGPILLEINARAGLKVQVANKAPLRKRLEQASEIKVMSPEKGVAVAKDVFGNKGTSTSTSKETKPKIGLSEIAELILEGKKLVLKAKIDPTRKQTVINRELKDLFKNPKSEVKIKFDLAGKRLQTVARFGKTPENTGLIIGQRDVTDFLIDVNKKSTSKGESKLPKSKEKNEKFNFYYVPQIDFGQVDYQIHEVASNIKLLHRLTPVNLKEEMAKFDQDQQYNPQFTYRSNQELVIELLKVLENIKTDDSNLGKVFELKRVELINQIRMIEHIGADDFTDLASLVYKAPTKDELVLAESMRKNYKYYQAPKSKKLNTKKASKIFEETLKKYNLNAWKVIIKQNMVGDISVNKSNAIFIKAGAKFSENRIKKLIAHEIETHILTAENGKRQPYRIFQDGTANYLQTQEGLAIYNQELAMHIYPHSYFASGNIIASDIVCNHSFSESYHILKKIGFASNKAKTLCLKVKRGIEDTAKKGGSHKQAIYFRGATEISKYVKDGGKLEELYIGKISLEQMHMINKLESLNKPTILPEWY